MEEQVVFVNNKQRRAFIIRGREYVREGYNIPIGILEMFERKCDLLGEDKSKIVEKLVTAFTEVNGWNEESRQAPVFEKRAGFHIKDSVNKTIRGMFPWRIPTN
ncbi:MAG TPA: hypothetical protein PLC32_04185 [Candidatus Omnitrophota bacterium]|nr:hypothetical protein [Candidatus Omnitrophota bacterium]